MAAALTRVGDTVRDVRWVCGTSGPDHAGDPVRKAEPHGLGPTTSPSPTDPAGVPAYDQRRCPSEPKGATVNDRRGPWALTDTGFCLTAVRDADALDVVAAYAGSPNAGKLQTHAEALDWAAGTYGEVLVRIGLLPPWAFALELTGSRGAQRPFLEALSAQHEVVSYFTTGAMTVIKHFRNGACLENSEIGTALANPFSESHYFFDRAERLKRKNGLDSQAGFSAVEESSVLASPRNFFGARCFQCTCQTFRPARSMRDRPSRSVAISLSCHSYMDTSTRQAPRRSQIHRRADLRPGSHRRVPAKSCSIRSRAV